MAAAAAAAAGAAGSAAPAAAAGASGSGGAPSGSQGVLIGDRLYSGVLITLENCLLPDDKLRFTPSMSSGLDTDTETDLRVVGCELIQAAGILLRLPQVRARPRASGPGGHGYRAGVVPALLLYQVLREALHGACVNGLCPPGFQDRRGPKTHTGRHQCVSPPSTAEREKEARASTTGSRLC
ncbi:CCNL2 isoform 19 [Pan troglodytes]|uniref:CCNL2 isoform 19 n=1 Tax=Pan troglodytes TaxID=9598 RepID=A0A2J8IRT4_PANTR|nr:CCNL2 isoform 19 [Pan troglodytes]